MGDRESSLDWRRLLVRSGVRFVDLGDRLDLSEETSANRAFLAQILACGGWAAGLSGHLFSPDHEKVDERRWLHCWERLHSGAEAGATGFDRIELELMDTYMAGVVRWLNSLHVATVISCDGHGKRPPSIEVAASDVPRTDALIRLASAGRLQYEPSFVLHVDPFSTASRSRERGRGPLPPRHRWPERRLLLDLAEHLFMQRIDAAER